MAKKEDTFEEKIIDADYSEVMSKSYIDYSMSVIVSRALPDVRDGLKPVQRRILYDMDRLKTTYDKPYRKSARIVGDTMGKYHPHGDSSIYGSLVVMAQDHKMGLPLVDGHGNFGSIEGDGAAAMRYTEARLQKITQEAFLSDLEKGVVPFIPNFDETEKEPEILPCKIPNLLVNGSEGIAVGMATSMPPHNLGEAIDGAIAVIKDPNISDEKLMEYIPGPDFPTGGIVSNKDELPDIYKNGIGKIKVRGKVEIENLKNGRTNLVITEIPYTMIGAEIGKFLNDVAALAENREADIIDISNQSSKDGIRIVIELKKDADPEYVKALLYKKTKLENTFGYNALAVVDKRPETLSLKQILKHFVEFQYELTEKKYHTIYEDAKKRSEIEEGLIKAVDVIDLIIEILRGSKTRSVVEKCLMNGITDGINFKTKKSQTQASKLRFTKIQTDAILDMRLQRLIGLELAALIKQHEATLKTIDECVKILGDRNAMSKVIISDLKAFKKYSSPRKTVIENSKAVTIVKKEAEPVPVVFLMDKFGYARIIDKSVYEKNKETADAENKYIVHCMSNGKILVFTKEGRMHTIPAEKVPYGKFRGKGEPIDNLCGYNTKDETVCSVVSLLNDTPLLFVTSHGYCKTVEKSQFDVTRKTMASTKLEDGDSVIDVFEMNKKADLLLATNQNRYLRFKASSIPEKGKIAVGVTGIRLAKNEEVAYSFLITENRKIDILGYEIDTKNIPLKKRALSPKPEQISVLDE